MLYLRSLLFNTALFVSVPFFAIVSLLCAWLPYPQRYQVIIAWQRSMVWLATLLCGIRYEVCGLENLPKQACVIASNHQSMWETLAFFAIFPDVCFVLKQELLHIPLFGWALRLLNPIAIDRSKKGSAMDQVLRQGKARLLAGHYVIIFPEGRRMATPQPASFRSGAATLAKHAGVPVIPVSHDAGKYWPRRSWIKRPGTVKVTIGTPILTTDKSVSQIQGEMVEAIIRQYNQSSGSENPSA